MTFREMHQQADPLLICNVWDAASAQTAEKLKFAAIGTSSAAIARMLGYEDGEQMPFSELEYIVERIVVSTSLPLSVDLEAGYSRRPEAVACHIKRLAARGIVGVNIEDSTVNPERVLTDAKQFAQMLSVIKKRLAKEAIEVFLNVRTDAFLLASPHSVAETQRRVQLYEKAGVDGIFVPCIEKESHIKAIVASTHLPINVMSMPRLPDFERLSTIGVKRISMGNFLFDHTNSFLEHTLVTVKNQQSFNSIYASH